MTTEAMLVVALLVMLGVLVGIELGRRFGRNAERARCLSLVSQSWQNESKLSPTARRISHSIDAGHAVLISESEFFGPEKIDEEAPPDGFWDSRCALCGHAVGCHGSMNLHGGCVSCPVERRCREWVSRNGAEDK